MDPAIKWTLLFPDTCGYGSFPYPSCLLSTQEEHLSEPLSDSAVHAKNQSSTGPTSLGEHVPQALPPRHPPPEAYLLSTPKVLLTTECSLLLGFKNTVQL